MHEIVAEIELFKACQILFGTELDVSREFLEYLQMSGIKNAYRQKARETHPDLALVCDKITERQQTDLFLRVQQAYENLSNYLTAREKGFRFPGRAASNIVSQGFQTGSPWAQSTRNRAGQAAGRRRSADTTRANQEARATGRGKQQSASSPPPPDEDWLMSGARYQGSMPGRTLLFGHFLYYSGLIDWRTIIKALVWQRTKRPRLGEIGCQRGWLSEKQILHILQNRSIFEPFGLSAVRMRLLNKAQLKVLIDEQKRLQKKFGEFFLEHKIFTPTQMTKLLHLYYLHNARQAQFSSRPGAR